MCAGLVEVYYIRLQLHTTVALRFWRALRASVLYGTEVHKVQKIIGDTVI